MTSLELSVVVGYALLLCVLSIYGSHRYAMAYLYYRHKYRLPTPRGRFETLPRVTVQLPMFNEMYVTERLIGAVAKIDYPRDLLEVQVLDDSTDETQGIARACVEPLAGRRGSTSPTCTGPTAAASRRARSRTGSSPPRASSSRSSTRTSSRSADFLRRTVHYFTDPGIGMVQARWGHLNRDYSLLTQAQAIMLDGHFVIEHTARNRSGRFFNFNGTAGIWRREAIAAGGGWQHDTLTEDLDLSYRAQLKGWRFVYLPHMVTPGRAAGGDERVQEPAAPLGEGLHPDRAQAPAAAAPRRPARSEVKREALIHLTANLAYLLMIPLAILLPITVVVRVSHGWYEVLFLDIPFFAAATFSVVALLRREPARAGAHPLGAAQVPADRDGARDRPLGEPGARGGRGAHGPRDRLHPHAEARRAAARASRSRRSATRRRSRFQPIVELGLAAYMTYGVAYLHRARGLLLAAVPGAVPGRLRLRRPGQPVGGAPRPRGALGARAGPAADPGVAARARSRSATGAADAAPVRVEGSSLQGRSGPASGFSKTATPRSSRPTSANPSRSQNARAPGFSSPTESRSVPNPASASACSSAALVSLP